MTLLLAILANASAGNIEWLDFILSGSGIAATADVAFTVFDRGLAQLTAHDGVKITLTISLGSITANGVTYTNAPTHHGGKLATATPADYRATNPIANFAYDLFRSSSGDNLATSIRDVTGTQGIAGSVIGFSDFNVPLGSLIHGHSLFSNDVTGVGSVANLAHWSNATTTQPLTGLRVELPAVTGVPCRNNRPARGTYGLIFGGAIISLVVFRRHRGRRGPKT